VAVPSVSSFPMFHRNAVHINGFYVIHLNSTFS
jgi:hypothetical protein